MDSVLNKIGLYDSIGVLLSGIVITICGVYMELPIILWKTAENDIVELLIFLLESYLIGLIMRDISLFFDNKVIKSKSKTDYCFLDSGNSVILNPLELDDYRNYANQILRKNLSNKTFTKIEQEYFFWYCRYLLIISEKNNEFDQIDASYVMARSLMMSFPIILICCFLVAPENVDMLKILLMILLTYLFYKRMKNYARLRVKVILRAYRAFDLTKK